ncbi:MAG: beta-lactamase family protein [Actinomycetota bacterium]|nr:beta-lactamase family protein [Actinomycetota bacterium]
MTNEPGPDTFDEELDALFGQHVAGGLAKGLVYGRTTTAGLVHTAGFGVADNDGLLPDADTVFPIASITKSFVACAALIACQRGALSLDEPITSYIPEFTASGTVEDPCDPPTIGMLLSMSGGLTEDNSWVDPFIDASEAELLEQVGHGLRYSHLPGSTFEYSNLGFTLAGLAVGRAVGQPIEDFVREQVFVPLGLTSTYFDNAAPVDISRATGYRYDEDGNWQPFPYTASAAFAAAGGMMSSVRDLASWITWLGSAFRPPADGDIDILSRAGRRTMQRVHALGIPALALAPGGALQPVIGGYGLGLGVYQNLHNGTQVAHSGGLPGFLLHVLWHPDSGNGMVALTNSQRGNAPGLCAQGLGRMLAKESSAAYSIVLWQETLDLQAQAEQLIREWDDGLAANILSDNVDFDRPLTARRAEIAELVGQIGPLTASRPTVDIVSAATAADLTWAIPGERGELICMIHLTPVSPAKIQEIVVRGVPAGTPRSAAPVDISARRAGLGEALLSASTNTRVVAP